MRMNAKLKNHKSCTRKLAFNVSDPNTALNPAAKPAFTPVHYYRHRA